MVYSYPTIKKIEDVFIFLLTECTNVTDRQTDGRTDTAHDGIGCACIASRGNKMESYSSCLKSRDEQMRFEVLSNLLITSRLRAEQTDCGRLICQTTTY